MSIGVLINPGAQGQLISDAVAAGAVVLTSTTEALAANCPVLQGDNKCVAPMGDAVTGRLPRQIPGGAYMDKLVLQLPTVPQSGNPRQLILGPNKS